MLQQLLVYCSTKLCMSDIQQDILRFAYLMSECLPTDNKMQLPVTSSVFLEGKREEKIDD